MVADAPHCGAGHDLAMGDTNSGDDPLIAQLPTVYAVALRLHGSGASHAAIAEALGTSTDAVPALLDVGRRKLDELRRPRDDA
jgi:DNA-directed RNA polymerase specialized sigma24 family protein